ncbi:hypothetical protein ACWGE0_41015 [Lentzea sp. NPDC054927]
MSFQATAERPFWAVEAVWPAEVVRGPKIVFLMFDGMKMLDVTGLFEVFAEATWSVPAT